VTERNRAEQKIRHLASHDLLTDLPNRAALDARLAMLTQCCGDAGDSFAVLCIDLDHFKEINDLFGHSMGDAVLREASRRLREAAQGAYVARVGGDEFIATIEQLPLPGSAELLASRMRDAFSRPIDIDGHSLEVDLSIGVALYPRDGETPVSLLANADTALYRAKHEGRGATRIFTSAMDQQLRDCRAMGTSFVPPSTTANSTSSTSRSVTGTARSPASRRWSAGSTRCAVSCCPASSFRRPRKAARLRRSTNGSLRKPAGRRRHGTSRCGSR